MIELNYLNSLLIDPLSLDRTDMKVKGIGDVNGDGLADFAVGTPYSDENGNNAGKLYVVFGDHDFGNFSTLNLQSLTPSQGFEVQGIVNHGQLGVSLDSADLNGDGFKDIIVSAPFADPNGIDSGTTYVINGGTNIAPSGTINLSTLPSTAGFTLNGININDRSGFQVKNAGDFNGDGIEDMLISAPFADPNGKTDAGQTYLVYGKTGGYSSSIELSTLDGTDGFVINGSHAGDQAGINISSGDFNGDGKSDLSISANAKDPNNPNKVIGQNYLIYGTNSTISSPIELDSLTSGQGLTLNGQSNHSDAQLTGDLNGDGRGEWIISSRIGGVSYVVYGDDSSPLTQDITTLANGTDGFSVTLIEDGITRGLRGGTDVGDLNGDGVSDVAFISTHKAFVLFGGNSINQIMDNGVVNLANLDFYTGFSVEIPDNEPYLSAVEGLGDTDGDGKAEMALISDYGGGTADSRTRIIYGAPEYEIESISQLGTPAKNVIFDIEADTSSNTYVIGETNGAMPENTLVKRIIVAGETGDELTPPGSIGNQDIFVTKRDANGNIIWQTQFGTIARDMASSIEVGDDGSLYAVGNMTKLFNVNSSWDGWFAKFDANGVPTLTYFGTDDSDFANAIEVDGSGNVYVVGETNGSFDPTSPNAGSRDGFIRKYNADGTVAWTDQFGSIYYDSAADVALDSHGNVYVTGKNQYDAILTKYSTDGTLQWTQTFDRPINSWGIDIEIDAEDNIFMYGEGKGQLDDQKWSGNQDVFLARYNTNGDRLWVKSLGSNLSHSEHAEDMTIGDDGNIYLSGSTSGILPGQSKAGSDAFWGTYDQNGNLLELEQFGTSGATKGNGITVDPDNNVFLAGYTSGKLAGETSFGNHQDWDAYITKYNLHTGNASNGDDILYGENGADYLNGFAGNDHLIGGFGNDVLNGGLGDDLLEGGFGDDTLIVALGEGTDTIVDFNLNDDVIGLSNGLTYADLTFSGSNIISGTQTLATLEGIDTSALNETDHFVTV